jgi:hypothetical protein
VQIPAKATVSATVGGGARPLNPVRLGGGSRAAARRAATKISAL